MDVFKEYEKWKKENPGDNIVYFVRLLTGDELTTLFESAIEWREKAWRHDSFL